MSRLRFKDLPPIDACFRPVEKVCEVELDGEKVGYIERTFRNSRLISPGVQVWYFRYCEGGSAHWKTSLSVEELKRTLHKVLAQELRERSGIPPSEGGTSYQREEKPRVMVRIFLGLKDSEERAIDPNAVIAWLREKLEDFTLSETQGFMKEFEEGALRIEHATRFPDQIKEVAGELAADFDQRTVGLEKDGLYWRIHAKKKTEPEAVPTVKDAAAEDRKNLTEFAGRLAKGEKWEDMPIEVKAWWWNRY